MFAHRHAAAARAASRAPPARYREKAVDDLDEKDGSTQTTASGLIRLASVVAGLTREGAIDTRFGGKLLKRVDKEARRLAEHGDAALDEAERNALFGAIGELDVALRQRDAALLVEANARLRDDEEVSAKRRKKKDSEKDSGT
jgi:hypothetical protein